MTVRLWNSLLRFFVLFFIIALKDSLALKDVVLTIEPKVVERLHQSTLKCTYDLQNAPLYSVKWYRGLYEFYRYTPSETPNTKVFPFTGITVDENNSNSTQVVLRDIEFNLSGNFSCEVTTDGDFLTNADMQTMLVVQLPDNPPKISVGRKPLDYGDTLRANCSSPPSKPPAQLKFFLNDIPVARSENDNPKKTEPRWSDLYLEMKLSDLHFNKGRLLLRCVAQIVDIYHEEAELELESARQPVPERVSAGATRSALTSFLEISIKAVMFSVAILALS